MWHIEHMAVSWCPTGTGEGGPKTVRLLCLFTTRVIFVQVYFIHIPDKVGFSNIAISMIFDCFLQLKKQSLAIGLNEILSSGFLQHLT